MDMIGPIAPHVYPYVSVCISIAVVLTGCYLSPTTPAGWPTTGTPRIMHWQNPLSVLVHCPSDPSRPCPISLAEYESHDESRRQNHH